jgi:hypothetical protein
MRGVGNVKGLVEPSAESLIGGLWSQLLTFLFRQQLSAFGNPGGAAAMDGRRFRTEPWMASPKIASASTFLERCGSTGCFLLVTFLCTSKEKLLAERRKLCF